MKALRRPRLFAVAALCAAPAAVGRVSEPLWYADAKASMVQVGQGGLTLGTPGTAAGNILTNGDIVALDFKVKPAYQLQVGRVGDDGEWRLAYWNYKHDAHADVNGGAGNGNVVANGPLTFAGLEGGLSFRL